MKLESLSNNYWFEFHCAFGNYLGEAICDRTVHGLRSKSIQKHLLAETELTLSKTLEIAKGMEAADCNAQKLTGDEGTFFLSK